VTDELWQAASSGMQFGVVAMVGRFEKCIRDLEENVKAWQEKASTNSRNSSKPPASDPPGVERPKKGKSGKSQGGQVGHKGHFHEMLPPEDVTKTENHYPTRCAHCDGVLPEDEVDPEPDIHQEIDIPPTSREVTNHQLHQRTCPRCKRKTRAKLPVDVPRSPYGPGVMARATYHTGRLRSSRRETAQALADIYGVKISVGAIKNIESRVTKALEPAVAELGAAIQKEKVINADETRWPEGNRKGYLWLLATPTMALYHVNQSRSQAVARELLGSFDGVLGTDRYAGYGWYPIGLRQVCHAHLKRDFQKMVDRGGDSARVGSQALAEQRRMFKAWHEFKQGKISRSDFHLKIVPIRERMMRSFKAGAECKYSKAAGTCKKANTSVAPPTPAVSESTDAECGSKKRENPCEGCSNFKTAGTCKNLIRDFPALWRFVYVDDVEPTNNTAEQAVRQAVLWRKGSFGSQSNAGSRYVERMLTGVETTRRQGRNFFVFLTATIAAAVAGLPSPSLLPGVEYVQPRPPQEGACSINPAPDAKPAPEQPSIPVLVDSS